MRHDRLPPWEGNKRSNVHHAQCTELAVALEMDTGDVLLGSKANLAQKAYALCKAMRYFIRSYKGRSLDDDTALSFQAIFHPRVVRCARDVAGYNTNGLGRRTVWNQPRTEELVACNLYRARVRYDEIKTR